MLLIFIPFPFDYMSLSKFVMEHKFFELYVQPAMTIIKFFLQELFRRISHNWKRFYSLNGRQLHNRLAITALFIAINGFPCIFYQFVNQNVKQQ